MTLSGRISAVTSRSSAQNSAMVAAGSEPEVSTMTAMASMPSERIEGRYSPPSMKRRLGTLQL